MVGGFAEPFGEQSGLAVFDSFLYCLGLDGAGAENKLLSASARERAL